VTADGGPLRRTRVLSFALAPGRREDRGDVIRVRCLSVCNVESNGTNALQLLELGSHEGARSHPSARLFTIDSDSVTPVRR
jgi:hypothetical protein